MLGKYDKDHAFQAQVQEAASAEVLFPGAIYDAPTVNALRFHCLAYMHGHRVGGTNPSLVEALGAGNPVIAHDNPFNRWVAGEAGVYFRDTAECSDRIERLLSDKAARETMRQSAHRRWQDEFRWPKVLESYRLLLEGALTP